MRLASGDQKVPNEFWSSLDGRLKPGLQVTLSLPVEALSWAPTAQPADSVAVDMARVAPPEPVARSGHFSAAEPMARR